jgi:uncharacterized protein (DUF736 family)
VIQILLIVALIALAPAPSAASASAAPGHRAALQGGAWTAPAERSGTVLAQNVDAPAMTAGIYAGKVDRRSLRGERAEARTYRLTMNPDMNTGKVLIYNPDGTLRSEIGLIGKMRDDGSFEGTTTVIDGPPNYKPDHVRLVFSPDRASVEWYHNDGTMEGSGTLSRSGK